MIELAFEILLWVGWTFPVWVGSNAVYYGTLGYVRCDSEMLAGCIGIAVLVALTAAGLAVRFR